MLYILIIIQGEIESAIADGMSRFEQDYMDVRPNDIHAHLTVYPL